MARPLADRQGDCQRNRLFSVRFSSLVLVQLFGSTNISLNRLSVELAKSIALANKSL